MNTLTAQTTIELSAHDDCWACAPDLKAIGHQHTFAVCVVDGVAVNAVPPIRTLPPVWLTELTELCVTCGGTGELQAFDQRNSDPCPDCIGDRHAVEVWQVCSHEGARMRSTIYLGVDGFTSQSGQVVTCEKCAHHNGVTLLGRGAIEHVLPVEHVNDGLRPDHWCIAVDDDGHAALWMGNGELIPLDITVTPGQYVVLVKMSRNL